MSGGPQYAKQQDSNQAYIVSELEKIHGIEVLDLSSLGGGCTDILIQKTTWANLWAGRTNEPDVEFFLVEIKTEKGKLNPKQVVFHAKFHCHIARSLVEVFDIIGF